MPSVWWLSLTDSSGASGYDLALSKLVRNSPIDREDVAQLARAVPLDPALLRARYERELRPIRIGDQERSDRTLRLWIEAYSERAGF
jgi:hypothetical protein